MQDIELAAQAHALMAGNTARDVVGQLGVEGWLTPETRAVLARAHEHLSRVNQMLRLLTDADPPGDLGAGGEAFVAHGMDLPDLAAVTAACDAAAAQAAAVIDEALK